MSITTEKKTALIKEFQRGDNDSGSPEIQCAILTSRIIELTEHMKVHKHDYGTRRGLLRMVSRRSRLMRYVHRQDRERYEALRVKLGLRK